MIYISLCAMPDRLLNESSSKVCLLALLNQDTDQPYQVLLNIPLNLINYTNTTIPDWVISLQKEYSDKLIILRDEIDYGPINNILSPLKMINMDEDDIIIVCDDDHEYCSNMVSYHLKKLAEYPDNHAICFRGNQPLELRTWYSDGKKYGKLYGSCVLFPARHDLYLKFPDHWHSVSYRRKFLKSDIFDKDFLNLTWDNDLLMGLYGWSHNFYYLCAYYDQENDFRPVNYDGRGANSFPIKTMLPFNGTSGCDRWRIKNHSSEVWNNQKFTDIINTDKGIIEL